MTDSMDGVRKLVDNPLLKEGNEIVHFDRQLEGPLDILPIYVDVTLGEHFEEISFDDATIIQHMRDEGFTDQQISEIPIHVSAEVTKGSGEGYIQGHYLRDKGEKSHIAIYPDTFVASYHEVLNEALKILQDQTSFELGGHDTYNSSSAQASNTLYHEIRHARQHIVDKDVERAGNVYRLRSVASYRLGLLATWATLASAGHFAQEMYSHDNPGLQILIYLGAFAGMLGSMQMQSHARDKSTYARYAANPVEVDARRAGATAPSNVVRAIVKDEALAVTYHAPKD
ncbi:MAG: hypothetical protein ABIP74_01805 [Candidatus Saccharimonas sp.]